MRLSTGEELDLGMVLEIAFTWLRERRNSSMQGRSGSTAERIENAVLSVVGIGFGLACATVYTKPTTLASCSTFDERVPDDVKQFLYLEITE